MPFLLRGVVDSYSYDAYDDLMKLCRKKIYNSTGLIPKQETLWLISSKQLVLLKKK